jgi:SAM-dependent methyltransferase
MNRLSSDYHDYGFKDGKLIGDFEGMYRHSAETPWHQDKTAFSVRADIALAMLKQYQYERILDIGCGLGYFTERMRRELSAPDRENPELTGYDISKTAVEKARGLFPCIRFEAKDILSDASGAETGFDLVVVRDIIWYVCHSMDRFITTILGLSSPGGLIYIGQSFPAGDTWVGMEVFACPEEVAELVGRFAGIVHTCRERDHRFAGGDYIHILARNGEDHRG